MLMYYKYVYNNIIVLYALLMLLKVVDLSFDLERILHVQNICLLNLIFCILKLKRCRAVAT